MKHKINLDDLCEDIYTCVPQDRAKFDTIMLNLKNQILMEDEHYEPKVRMNQKGEVKQFGNFNTQNQPFGQINQREQFYPLNQGMMEHKDFNKNNFNQQNQNAVHSRYMTTLPEGEMINMKPIQNKAMHRNYTDVHANSKFYYPEEYENRSDLMKDSQWTDRANNIHLMYNMSPRRFNEEDPIRNNAIGMNKGYKEDFMENNRVNNYNDMNSLNNNMRSLNIQSNGEMNPELRMNRNMLLNNDSSSRAVPMGMNNNFMGRNMNMNMNQI